MSKEGGELASLADQADRQDEADQAAPGPGSAPGAPEAPASSPNLGAIAMLLTTFRTIAGAMLGVKSLATTLDDTNIARCAETLAPVADKYGLDLSTAFTGPEAAAILVAGPILWTAAQQLQHELKAKRAKPVDGVEVTPGSEDPAPHGVDG